MNPYEILGIRQDASKKEILKAQMLAMKEKKYSLQEIASASKQLLNPAKRLAADFLMPKKIRSKRPKEIEFEIDIPSSEIKDFNHDDFDSLKYLTHEIND